MEQANKQIKSLKKDLAACRAELENEKNNIKIKTVEKKIYTPQCSECNKTMLEKNKQGYEALKNTYVVYVFALALYSLFLTIFQISKAEYFKQSFVELLNAIENAYNWIHSVIMQIEPSQYYVVNVLLKFVVGLIVVVVVIGIFILLMKFYCHDYISHWGTAMQILLSLFLIINLDKWIASWWHTNALLLFFVIHCVYLIIIFIVRTKMDS